MIRTIQRVISSAYVHRRCASAVSQSEPFGLLSPYLGISNFVRNGWTLVVPWTATLSGLRFLLGHLPLFQSENA